MPHVYIQLHTQLDLHQTGCLGNVLARTSRRVSPALPPSSAYHSSRHPALAATLPTDTRGDQQASQMQAGAVLTEPVSSGRKRHVHPQGGSSSSVVAATTARCCMCACGGHMPQPTSSGLVPRRRLWWTGSTRRQAVCMCRIDNAPHRPASPCVRRDGDAPPPAPPPRAALPVIRP